ncbi:MAG: Nudix family hydrolase [Methylococcaceae bacterium]|nr:Nudix family hydrolase [Methylococcaceae bacterium]
MAERRHFHVAAGVVVNGDGEVLIARRDESLHQGGLWEFPGGKIEPGETVEQALRRELEEEVAITLERSGPLLRIHHAYPDRDVTLDVLRVEEFSGTPRGMQGQPVCWVPPGDLAKFEFPAANRAIVTAAQLPERYAILDLASLEHRGELALQLQAFADAHITLLRARSKGLDAEAYRALALSVLEFGNNHGIRVLLDLAEDWAWGAGAAGVHLDSVQLRRCMARPVGRDRYFAASCHDLAELERAAALGADFALLSPVLPTETHPHGQPLGWQRFGDLVDHVNLPVYALGGLRPHHLALARIHGGQGIAGIRGILGQ